MLLVLRLALHATGCEICDGVTKGDDNVLEVTADALEELARSHPLLLLLL